jgi:hypothetical protein
VADAPPSPDDLDVALDRLPMIAERLPHLPQPEIRALIDAFIGSSPTSQPLRLSMSN